MKVRVKLFGVLYELVGSFKVELDVPNDTTIRGLIGILAQTFNPKITDVLLDNEGKLRGDYAVLINGKAIEWVNGLDTRLSDGDEVVILPPAEGG
ncbi:ubiquitin-like small modifier protein 1 [Vulcanisaeta thermophila]|uniref:ubiquitin-like small modifier protein 1 n=1 Tax=Vulcanisaeta thermophila TaxID=867917 RepID=UPI000853743B|nr:ubiquitin-like small modifier protein 1 [Vulcanisaeta thermophila]